MSDELSELRAAYQREVNNYNEAFKRFRACPPYSPERQTCYELVVIHDRRVQEAFDAMNQKEARPA